MMVFGFRTFGLHAQPLLLNNYHKTEDIMASLARLATGFSIVCGFPLMFAGQAHDMSPNMAGRRS